MVYSRGKEKGFEEIKNLSGKTPLEYAKSFSKDINALNTIEGLIKKLHTSTKVITNSHIK